jgi:hypothetical protein
MISTVMAVWLPPMGILVLVIVNMLEGMEHEEAARL